VSERVVNARGVHVEVVKMTSLWAIYEFSRLYLGYNALAAREPVRAQEVREEGSTSAKEALFRARGVGIGVGGRVSSVFLIKLPDGF